MSVSEYERLTSEAAAKRAEADELDERARGTQLSRADMGSMSNEAINEARRSGQFADLLAGKEPS